MAKKKVAKKTCSKKCKKVCKKQESKAADCSSQSTTKVSFCQKLHSFFFPVRS